MIGEIPAALDGQRVDRAVALLTGVTRAEAAALVDGGHVRVDGGEVASRTRRVRAGEHLAVDAAALPERNPALAADPEVVPDVVHADEDVVVVNKPAGLVVHPGSGHERGTLVQGLLARFPDLAALATGDAMERPGIVQRLDKGTSGLLVVARSLRAQRSLVAQLAGRNVERRYSVLVTGDVAADEGVVDAPIGRSPSDPTRMAVVAGGRPARTRYRVETRYHTPDEVSLLECSLETGRTHQIRVHLAAIDHPVLGDAAYGAPPGPRPFLHAGVLGFEHPAGGRRRFVAPIPDDLAAWLARYS